VAAAEAVVLEGGIVSVELEGEEEGGEVMTEKKRVVDRVVVEVEYSQTN
jgi:hypothetical protein